MFISTYLDLEKLPSVEEAKKQQAEQSKIRDAQQRQEAAQARAEKKRIEAFKHHTEKEASKAFDAAVYGAADAERRRIENLYFELNLKHIEQQEIHQKQATLGRTRAEDEIEETYRFKEKTEEIKATQARLNTKATFWGKITGKHEREKVAAEKELKDLRRAYAENLQKAEQNRQRVENLIRQDADNMAEAQKRERDDLPPKMPEREPTRSHA